MKANSVITYEVDDAGVITFRVRGVDEPIIVDTGALGAMLRQRALVHGIVQKISDRAAIERNPETGAPATPADKHARMAALARHMTETGEWTMRATTRGARENPIIAAVAAVQGTDYATMAARVAAQIEKRGVSRAAYLRALGGQPAVLAELARRADGAGGVDLAELGD